MCLEWERETGLFFKKYFFKHSPITLNLKGGDCYLIPVSISGLSSEMFFGVTTPTPVLMWRPGIL